MELGVIETSDYLRSSTEQVSSTLYAGNKCINTKSLDKMKSVESIIGKVQKRVRDTFRAFSKAAKITLTDLKDVLDFVVNNKMENALRRVENVCETTEALVKQVESLKSYVDSQGSEMHENLEALGNYLKKRKESYESHQRELRQQKQSYLEQFIAAESSAKEAEEKARVAETNARKEMEEWEEFVAETDEFESGDQNPFKKRRSRFLKVQQEYEAEAEESKRSMERSRLKITGVEKENDTENKAFMCINDTITGLKEATDRFDVPTASVSLFEDLKKDCTDLFEEIRSTESFSTPKVAILSQVCDKAKKIFAKWQALSNVSLYYVSRGDI